MCLDGVSFFQCIPQRAQPHATIDEMFWFLLSFESGLQAKFATNKKRKRPGGPIPVTSSSGSNLPFQQESLPTTPAPASAPQPARSLLLSCAWVCPTPAASPPAICSWRPSPSCCPGRSRARRSPGSRWVCVPPSWCRALGPCGW